MICVMGVGRGKTITALGWVYYKFVSPLLRRNLPQPNVYIVTTAKKRDSKEWEADLAKTGWPFTINVTSWNKIKDLDVDDSIIIFDEQRASGYQVWGKQFIKLCRRDNRWIMLSATPGDDWMDYMPFLIANGHYKNKTDFCRKHVIYDNYAKFPKIKGYMNTQRLEDLITSHVYYDPMGSDIPKVDNHIYLESVTDDYNLVTKKYINPFTGDLIEHIGALYHTTRKVLNSDEARIKEVKRLIADHKKLIVFYNYVFELDIIKQICEELGKPFYQLNGQYHEQYEGSEWCYAVQYTSGKEGWNCKECDTIVFYSLPTTWKTIEQARGRIDRIGTPYRQLNYHYIHGPKWTMDTSIWRTLENRGYFNKNLWVKTLVEENGDVDYLIDRHILP